MVNVWNTTPNADEDEWIPYHIIRMQGGKKTSLHTEKIFD
jgi:hypothetical protein